VYMSSLRVLVLLVAAFALAAARCDDSNPPPSSSGIEGLVTIGPMCPVERADTPCPDKMYAANIVVLNTAGDEAARTQSGDDGRFRVDVAPGNYTLVAQSPNGVSPPSAPRQDVVVRDGEYTHVDVQFDSGIR
jgi:hypothetical protein